jgi:hypothetical protein
MLDCAYGNFCVWKTRRSLVGEPTDMVRMDMRQKDRIDIRSRDVRRMKIGGKTASVPAHVTTAASVDKHRTAPALDDKGVYVYSRRISVRSAKNFDSRIRVHVPENSFATADVSVGNRGNENVPDANPIQRGNLSECWRLILLDSHSLSLFINRRAWLCT